MYPNMRRIKRAGALLLTAGALSLSLGPGVAAAGTNGQQIGVYGLQEAVKVCGNNQNGHWVCHAWTTPYYDSYLNGWWWKYTVVIYSWRYSNFSGYIGYRLWDIPVNQRSNWSWCSGW